MPFSAADNALLTRVQDGAPMGAYLRNTVWFPVVVADALRAGEAPLSVRLLGEDFVAFRALDGRVGFFAEHCPHRGASLLLARNEGNALRCIFHGWKFRVDGTTVEVPTQAQQHSAFCQRVPLEHHATHEALGVVWVWLGAGVAPPFYNFEFVDLKGEHVCPVHSVLDFNWLQALEGLVDSAHVSILHQDWLARIPVNPKLANAAHDAAPVYEFEDNPRGFRYAALRRAPGDKRYVRITEFIGPWFSFTPGDQGSCFLCVPIDDTHTAFWSIRYDRARPIEDSPWKPQGDPMHWPPALPGGAQQRWGQDRASMQQGAFSGFRQHFFHEDTAVAASQGPIASRRHEFMNSGDEGVFRLRRWLLERLRGYQAGGEPQPFAGEAVRISSGHGLIEPRVDWRDHPFA